jgi:hypothetical protein
VLLSHVVTALEQRELERGVRLETQTDAHRLAELGVGVIEWKTKLRNANHGELRAGVPF